MGELWVAVLGPLGWFCWAGPVDWPRAFARFATNNRHSPIDRGRVRAIRAVLL